MNVITPCEQSKDLVPDQVRSFFARFTQVCTATDAALSITIVMAQSPIGKRMHLATDGTVEKQSPHTPAQVWAMTVAPETHEQMAQLLRLVADEPCAALINAGWLPVGLYEMFLLVSKRALQEQNLDPFGVHEFNGATAFARLKEHATASCWIPIDRDIDDHTPEKYRLLSVPELLATLEPILPGIEHVTRVETPSSSARVLLQGRPLSQGNGHTWVLVQDGELGQAIAQQIIPRALQAGLAWAKPRESRKNPGEVIGHAHVTLIDPAPLHRGRFVFSGKPTVSEGLQVAKPDIRVVSGRTDILELTDVPVDAEAATQQLRKAGLPGWFETSTTGGIYQVEPSLEASTELVTTQGEVLTAAELATRLKASEKIRLQAPFRASNSGAAFGAKDQAGDLFVFDTGTNTRYVMSAAFRAQQFEEVGSTRAQSTWQDPQPLVNALGAAAYPVDALPSKLRAAIQEVHAFVQAPVALLANSALGALSVSCQAHIDIKRSNKLIGPCSLFLLSIADSGERKSSVDSFFTAAIREYERQQRELAEPELTKHTAAMAAWNAQREGLLTAIRAKAKAGKPTDVDRRTLHELEQEKPVPPRVPKLLLGDITPEALAFNLAKQWPSAGVISAEAGVVFGSHGMGKDSVTRNLALLNQLWSGEPLHVGRRTSESFTVDGARLSVSLQVQEGVLTDFFTRCGGLARNSGFLARFLIAWPESTQGTRMYRESDAWPALNVFNARITEILNHEVAIDDSGQLQPHPIELSLTAKQRWVEFHDTVEQELIAGGELVDLRDVASKAAENAARIASLFHVFEHGLTGTVGQEHMGQAIQIVSWHLYEAKRFFGELALPRELADATRVEAWLVEQLRNDPTEHLSKRHLRQYGPVRDGERLQAALRELTDADRVRIQRQGKQSVICLHPTLIGGSNAQVV